MSAGGRSFSYDAAPPLSTPLRFFLSAPAFGIAAGLVLLALPEALQSRWTPGALAATHLVAVGFMLSVMVGALFQLLPVMAGAGMPRARPVATLAHAGLTAGAAMLAAGLGAGSTALLVGAAGALGTAFALFLAAAAYGLWRIPAAQTAPRDLRLALAGLGIAVMLGMTLAMILARGLPLPLLELLKLHVGWAWLGGAGVLLASTSWVVVPMFQITPEYPAKLKRYWAIGVSGLLVLWSAAVLLGFPALASALVVVLLGLAATFATATLRLQRHTRRATPDASFRAFQLGMACLIAGLAAVAGAHAWDHARWPLLAGVLVLHGGFVGVIEGMLHKIVPFLAWLHLTQAGIKAPNVKKLLPETRIRRQLAAHAVALAALLLAVATGHPLLARLAGALVAMEFGWLLWNQISVLRAYRAARNAAA